MTSKVWKMAGLVLLQCLPTWAAPAIPTPNSEFTGRVVDADTAMPINNAVVSLCWTAQKPKEKAPERAIRICDLEWQTSTNSKGDIRFLAVNRPELLPASVRNSANLQVRVQVFAPGYKTREEHVPAPGSASREAGDGTASTWTGNGGVFRLKRLDAGGRATTQQFKEMYEHLHNAVTGVEPSAAAEVLGQQMPLFLLFAQECGQLSQAGRTNEACVKGQAEFVGSHADSVDKGVRLRELTRPSPPPRPAPEPKVVGANAPSESSHLRMMTPNDSNP
jgi:hypothetical protein